MTLNGATTHSFSGPLVEYLTAEQIVQLRAGTLSPEAISSACTLMRAELSGISSYIPVPILRQQLAAPVAGQVGGAYWDGTVLFADLSGFTALSGQLSALGKQGAEEISAIINSLFGALVEEIHYAAGSLLKFGGDAITAFFDAATLGASHAALAASAALAMQARMAAFATLATRAGTFTLRLRIGVHSGRVFAAQVGDLAHIELVVTGRDINRVALAQEIAEPGEVVVSDATRALLLDATTYERSAGFYLLQSMSQVVASRQEVALGTAEGAGDTTELLRLSELIAALRPYLPHRLPRRFLEPDGAGAGEFRPVTVLFANFAPFSSALDLLGADSDTAAQILNAYYQGAQAVIHRYGGIVNKVDMYTHGDKLMALFGAPVAHEDDPHRAILAALDLRAALAEANAEIAPLLQPVAANQISADSPFLTQRIGINTGVVFAGQVGSALRHEYTVMGQHVNLSARLMSAAAVDTVVISPATRRAVEGRFVLQDLPPAHLKGMVEPVALAEVLRPLGTVQEIRGGLTQAELVGREAELEAVIASGRAALNGTGQIVALVGEAGSGKTRLIEEAVHGLVIRSGLRAEDVRPFLIYSAECQSYDQNTPYAVVRAILRQLFNLNLFEAPALAGAISERVRQLAVDLERFTPLLGDILGLRIEDTPLTAALSPEQRHDRAQDLVVALILAEARDQPLLLIIDDLHWADASSLDLLERVARPAAQVPLLMLLGYRGDPPISEPWRDLSHSLRLVVAELAPTGSAALVRALLRGDPPAGLDALIDKAQGNPFYIQEVVRSLVESGVLQQVNGIWQLPHSLDELVVPDSVEGVITARLDRLDEVCRDVAQVAAVIGRHFAFPVLAGVMVRRDNLAGSLGRLSEADMVLPEDAVTGDIAARAYLFKQALTRDVAYETILYARRRDLHRRVANQIATLERDRPDEQLALLARHYLLAEEWGMAFDYHLRAGRQAQRHYANREAITLFERALAVAPRLEHTDGSDLRIVELHERLGVIHALIGEYDPALERYQAALELQRADPRGSAEHLVRLHHHIARVYEKRAAFDTAFEWVERALELSGNDENEETVRCLLLGAGLHKRQGRNAQAIEWAERALAMADRLANLTYRAQALKLLGSTYLNLGDNTRAFELLSRSLELYKQSQDLVGLADAHNDMANICHELGRLADARANYEAGAEIKRAIGDVYGQAMIANNLGYVLKIQGDIAGAIGQFERSLASFEQLGSLYATGVLHMNLGATYLMQNSLDLAADHLRLSGELYAHAGAEEFLPELDRYVADLQMRRGDLAAARDACERSLAAAERLEARSEEGATRRVLGQILARDADLAGAWIELERSRDILREANHLQELAITLVALAGLAPQLGRHAEGQTALDEAMPVLHEIGALQDIAEAREIALREGYTLKN